MIYWKLAEMPVPEAKPNLTAESAWPGEYLINNFLTSMTTKLFDESIRGYLNFNPMIEIKLYIGQES
jgi:hypothetical protein